MNHHRWWSLGLAMAVLWMGATAAWAGHPLVNRLENGPPHYPPTENRYAHVPPGQERFYVRPVEAYPTLSHGAVVPSYNWGSFGARYYPRMVGQSNYYTDYVQWGYRPGR